MKEKKKATHCEDDAALHGEDKIEVVTQEGKVAPTYVKHVLAAP